MPTPPSPDTVPPTELTPQESPESPQLPPPLLPEDTPLPEDTSPTLPELSMLPRERLRLRLMLLSSTEPMDMLVSHTLDTLPMVLTHMPTELTTERDPLMPSQRPMPTTDTTDMPDLTPTDMLH